MDDRTLRAIASGNRRSLLDALAVRPGRSASVLAGDLGISRQATARHLAVLEAAGIVVTVRHGRERQQYLKPNLVADGGHTDHGEHHV